MDRADHIADAILAAFNALVADHRGLTRRGRRIFEQRDFGAFAAVSRERHHAYRRCVERAVRASREELPEDDREVWARAKELYARRIADRSDEEIAETFFNSVTRARFRFVGVDARIEFVWFEGELMPSGDESPIYQAYFRTGSTAEAVRVLLEELPFEARFLDLERDVTAVAERIEARCRDSWGDLKLDAIEVAKPVLYRNKAAYVVGRVRRANRIIPLAIALRHEPGGVVVDAVLLTENEVSVVFSLTRQYFFAEVPRPAELIGFLRSVLPVKPINELYTALGYVKHGKTVFYRELGRHLERSNDKFVSARGTKGMVMCVFTLPSLDVVFKLIKDEFDQPKKVTHAQVRDRYRMVLESDRAGRLLDAQEFELLTIPRHRFAEELLEELVAVAGRSVQVRGDEVLISHVYVSRRVYPLNLYVEELDRERAVEAVIDYGHAIKDLAAANLFAGDLLVKNFGVTRHGRVVFYDYDELCLLTDCQFRTKPEPNDDDEAFAAEPWFFVGENDIFPEELRGFMWPPGPLREAMDAHHGDLFGIELWRGLQAKIRAGASIDVFPYGRERRLPHRRPSTDVG